MTRGRWERCQKKENATIRFSPTRKEKARGRLVLRPAGKGFALNRTCRYREREQVSSYAACNRTLSGELVDTASGRTAKTKGPQAENQPAGPNPRRRVTSSDHRRKTGNHIRHTDHIRRIHRRENCNRRGTDHRTDHIRYRTDLIHHPSVDIHTGEKY